MASMLEVMDRQEKERAAELASLRAFRWNVLQAWDRGGDWYLRKAVAYLVKSQGLRVDEIIKSERPDD